MKIKSVLLILFLILSHKVAICNKSPISALPQNIKNLIIINLKKYFNEHTYEDLYKFEYVKRRKIFFELLNNLMDEAKIELKTDFKTIIMSNTFQLKNISLDDFVDKSLIILKINYKMKSLNRAILKRFENKISFKIKAQKTKKFYFLGRMFFNKSIHLYDNKTVFIGKIDKILAYIKNKKDNSLKKQKFTDRMKRLGRNHFISFSFELSDVLKTLFDPMDKNFNINVKDIKNIEGNLDVQKAIGIMQIRIIMKKNIKAAVRAIKKILAMSAMGGVKYIEMARKINISEIKNGVKIFFRFNIE